MDEHSAIAISLLECIATCNQQFIDLFLWLGSVPNSTRQSHDIYCKPYKTGTMLELYVEAEIDGKTICWLLDVTWSRQVWLIRCSVLVNENDDRGENVQRVLKEFSDRTSQTFEDFAEQLKNATSDLVAYARSMDLSPPCA